MPAIYQLLAPSLLTIIVFVSATPAIARETVNPPATGTTFAVQEASADDNVKAVVIWAIVGIGLLSMGLGVLYLLKRELGGFEPRVGGWTAPISVIRSGNLPEEESDFPADGGEDHGH